MAMSRSIWLGLILSCLPIRAAIGAQQANSATRVEPGRTPLRSDSSELDSAVEAAAQLFRRGQIDEALEAYDSARLLAERQSRGERAFELGYLAATIEHQRGRHAAASLRYRKLALVMPEHAQAAEAHWLAIYHAGQIARTGQADLVGTYRALLEEHLKTWPAEASSDKVHWQLGRLREHQRDWTGAIVEYREVSAGSAEHLQALEAVARCCHAWLDERRAGGEADAPILADALRAADWFESLILGPRGVVPERWSPPQQLAALAAAKLRMEYTPDGYGRAERILVALLANAAELPASRRSAAEVLMIGALAGEGRGREASDLLDRILANEPGIGWAVLEGLDRVTSSARSQMRPAAAALELRTIESLRRSSPSLTPPQQEHLKRAYARALADTGQTEEAIRAYRALAQENPDNGAVQEAYAQLLLGRTDRPGREAALSKWRELEERSPHASDRWFRAQYAVALLEHQLGSGQQAARRIRLLQAQYPAMGGPEMKTKFTELLGRCNQ